MKDMKDGCDMKVSASGESKRQTRNERENLTSRKCCSPKIALLAHKRSAAKTRLTDVSRFFNEPKARSLMIESSVSLARSLKVRRGGH